MPDQIIENFHNCKNCPSPPDFNKSQEEIFQKLMAKEIERLIKGINWSKRLQEQAKFLFNMKGYYPDLTPAVWDDHKREPIINLTPETKRRKTRF